MCANSKPSPLLGLVLIPSSLPSLPKFLYGGLFYGGLTLTILETVHCAFQILTEPLSINKQQIKKYFFPGHLL